MEQRNVSQEKDEIQYFFLEGGGGKELLLKTWTLGFRATNDSVFHLEELDDRHEVEEPEWRQVLPPFPTVED